MNLSGMFAGRYGLFSRGQYLQPNERTLIVEFMARVKNKEDITDLDKKLKEDIDIQWEQYLDNLEEDELELVAEFMKYWDALFDDRTKREKLDELIENILTNSMGMSPAAYDSERQKYYPAEYGKELPRKGAWVMLLDVLPIEDKAKNEPFDIYYAIPIPSKREFGDKLSAPYYKVQIVVRGHEVTVWPHEYVPYDIKEVLQGVGTQWEFKKLGGDTNYDSAKVHYLRTRGIKQETVYEMLMASVSSVNYCYYRLVDEARPYFQFTIDCLLKGIRPEMIDRLWEHKQTGKPLFNIINVNDTDKSSKSKNRKKGNSKSDKTKS